MGTQPNQSDYLPYTLLALTVVAGVIDAVSFLALGHVFTANMTGNVVFMAFAAAGAPGLSFVRSALALVAFLVGAVMGGRLAVAAAARPGSRWPATPFAMEAALLLAAACASVGIAQPENPLFSWLVIILTGVAMGVRNATVRKLAVPDLTTTVLTLTLTGIAADSSLAGGKNPRWGTRATAVLGMFVGAAIGALLVRYSLFVALAACSIVVAVGAVATLRRPQVSAT
jgi:uncharacterized membrane protein YoaK (UPF0700 family)